MMKYVGVCFKYVFCIYLFKILSFKSFIANYEFIKYRWFLKVEFKVFAINRYSLFDL